MAADESRAPRLRIHPLKNVEFRLEGSKEARPFRVANLSASGIGILKDPATDPTFVWPPIGQSLKGAIATRNQAVAVTVEIVHSHLAVVGGRFLDNLTAISAFVSKWFRTELKAVRLTEVNAAVLKKPPRGTARWFQDGSGNELYWVAIDGKIDYFRVVFMGNIVERLSTGALRTGMVESEDRDGLEYKGSELVRDVPGVPKGMREAAISFVENVRGLEPEWKAQIVSPLETPG